MQPNSTAIVVTEGALDGIAEHARKATTRAFQAICSQRAPIREEVEKLLLWGDSYERLPMLLEILPHLPRPMLFGVLGDYWEGFDNIGHFRLPLAKLLRSATRAELDLMMTTEERSALAAMPEAITVYRGCYRINRRGLSWSIDINIAARFPTLMRYMRHGEHPLLLQAIAYRDRAVVKLGRKESEVIVFDAHQIEEAAYAAA